MFRSLRRAGPRSEQRETRSEENLAGSLITIVDPANAASEAYRTLRANLLYTLVDEPPKVIVLTSAGSGEGKSTVCANLGVVLAQAAKNTLIIDCDLRRPMIHQFFGLRNLQGLVDVLVGERSLQEVWHEPVERLKVVPVGSVPLTPAEMLGSQRFSKLLAGVREQFDYVLTDSPPIGLVSDPLVLAAQGDGVLLVLDAQNTRKGAVRQAIRDLQAVGAHVLGTVMNNVKVSRSEYYKSDYGHAYEH